MRVGLQACSLGLVIALAQLQEGSAQSGFTGPGNYLLLSGDSNSSLCLQECSNNDCGIGSNGLLLAADVCDQRVSQLWAISESSNQLQNAGTGSCITVQTDDNLTMAPCSGKADSQGWQFLEDGTLQSAYSFDALTVCGTGDVACLVPRTNEFIVPGEAVGMATAESAASQQWTLATPHASGWLIQSSWHSSNGGSAFGSTAVSSTSASTSSAGGSSATVNGQWCLQRCSDGDCGDVSQDANVVVASVCDQRLGQMWYNDTSVSLTNNTSLPSLPTSSSTAVPPTDGNVSASSISSQSSESAAVGDGNGVLIRSVYNRDCLTMCGRSARDAEVDIGTPATPCNSSDPDYYTVQAGPCTGASTQLWQWVTTSGGIVVQNAATGQALSVCSDAQLWCSFLLQNGPGTKWTGRRVSGLPTDLQPSEAQTFSTQVVNKLEGVSVDATASEEPPTVSSGGATIEAFPSTELEASPEPESAFLTTTSSADSDAPASPLLESSPLSSPASAAGSTEAMSPVSETDPSWADLNMAPGPYSPTAGAASPIDEDPIAVPDASPAASPPTMSGSMGNASRTAPIPTPANAANASGAQAQTHLSKAGVAGIVVAVVLGAIALTAALGYVYYTRVHRRRHTQSEENVAQWQRFEMPTINGSARMPAGGLGKGYDAKGREGGSFVDINIH